jgi:serine/threonine protein kinase
VHRDYKLENLLFDEDFNLKIGDLGLCESIWEENAESEVIHKSEVIQI